MRRALIARCLVTLMSAGLGGCILYGTPGDLKLASVRLVDSYDQAELPWYGDNPPLAQRSEDQPRQGEASLPRTEKPHTPVLKVEFTSATDLSKLAMDNSFTVGNETSFCDDSGDSRFRFMSNPFVFWHGARIVEYGADSIAQSGGPGQSIVTYYVFINVSGDAHPNNIPPQAAFDLRQKPADVCFYVRGGTMWGSRFWSNTVVIPMGAISAALRNAPPNVSE